MNAEWILSLATLISCWVAATLAFDLVAGHGGMFSLGSSGLVAIGGYTYGILTLTGWHGVTAAVAAASLSSLVAAGVALALSRLTGDLFALASFGLHRLAFDLAQNLDGTGGAVGLRGIHAISTVAGRSTTSLIFAVVVLLVAFETYRRLTESPFGRSLRASRDDAMAARSTGDSPRALRVRAFAAHGTILGLVGAVLVSNQGSLSPGMFSLDLGTKLLAMSILGGLGTWRGAAIGVVVVMAIEEAVKLSNAPPWFAGSAARLVVDCLLLACLIWRPAGLAGTGAGLGPAGGTNG